MAIRISYKTARRNSLGLISISTLILAAVLIAACASNKSAVSQKNKPSLWPQISSPATNAQLEAKVETLLTKMSLEEKVGQIMQAEIQTVTPGDVKKYHLGSILNGGGSLPRRKQGASAADWVNLADEFYDESMDDSDGFVAIPIIWGTDAVHGHNNLTGATIYPHNMGLGAANNPELIRAIGEATAKEVRATGIEWVFAPTLAVAQNDRWGRTYESYSEDPNIVRAYSDKMVEGLQSAYGADDFLDHAHVVATAKHFLADGGTFEGDDQGDTRISEGELIRIHNAGYEPAITSGVQSIMASFSSWNGEKLHGHQYLLTDILKERMGFDGFVVGDWNGHGQVPGCTNDSCAESINAGVDMIMVPYDWREMIPKTIAQVESGEISMTRLDDAVRRILRVKMRANLFEGLKPSERKFAGDQNLVGAEAHREIARQAVRESLVLLKNKNNVLPIKANVKILLAGDGADNIGKQSGGWSVTWQGMGTKNEDFPGATSIYAGIAKAVEAAGGNVELNVAGKYKDKPDVAVVVFGENPYAEGQGDRDSLEYEAGNKQSIKLLKKLKAQGIPVVSVFLSGRPMWVNPELNASDAFVAAWLPGSEGAGIADVLIAKADGSVNYDFKGRLSFSWPKNPTQDVLNPHHDDYDPLFALGYGLNYADAKSGPDALPENVVGVTKGDAGVIPLYVGRPLQPWVVYIHDHEHRQILNGAFASLPQGQVTVRTADKDLQEDALLMTWKDTWSGRLTLEGGTPMNLNDFIEAGSFSFDLNVESFAKAGLKLVLNCGGFTCQRSVSLDDYARENIGAGWKTVSVPVACLAGDNDDFSAVPLPFSFEMGAQGSAQIQVANIRLNKVAQGNIDCANYSELSVDPQTLREYWALDWWEARHKEKLARVAAGDVDLLFIGDSITQGWENEGKAVWEMFYSKRKALNLGYGGDRTENVLWRFEHGELEGLNPKVAVLMIGTNNTGHRHDPAELTAKGIKKVVEELRQRLPSTKILLLGIFPRGEAPEDELRKVNVEINGLIQAYADAEYIHYLNIGDKFLDENELLSKEIMPDLLHLSPAGYVIWAKTIEDKLSSLLGE